MDDLPTHPYEKANELSSVLDVTIAMSRGSDIES